MEGSLVMDILASRCLYGPGILVLNLQVFFGIVVMRHVQHYGSVSLKCCIFSEIMARRENQPALDSGGRVPSQLPDPSGGVHSQLPDSKSMPVTRLKGQWVKGLRPEEIKRVPRD